MAHNVDDAVDIEGAEAGYFEKEITQAANDLSLGIFSKKIQEWVVGDRGGIRRAERSADGAKDGVVVVEV